MSLPPYRYLRGYSLDPGFSTRLDTAGINEVVYRIPFEPLEPGPIGEYIEVMDVDPATDAWYEPVDLGDETDRVPARPGAERRQPAVSSAVRLRGGDEDHPPFRARARPQDRLVSARAPARHQGRTGRRTFAGIASTCSACASIRTRSARPTPTTIPTRPRCSSATSPPPISRRARTIPAAWSSPASAPTSSPTRRRTRFWTPSTTATWRTPIRTSRRFTRVSPTSSRCCSGSPSASWSSISSRRAAGRSTATPYSGSSRPSSARRWPETAARCAA